LAGVNPDHAGAIQVMHASKSYGDVRALNDVTFSVARGEIVALLGPNGAGKTTLISLIAGVIRPDSGSVTVRGIDVSRRSREARRSIGYAAQELAIYPGSTVRENLLLFAHLIDIPRPVHSLGRTVVPIPHEGSPQAGMENQEPPRCLLQPAAVKSPFDPEDQLDDIWVSAVPKSDLVQEQLFLECR
jgi:ABC-type Fe3+/spermidine/putrescine transport system ATPase subunit